MKYKNCVLLPSSIPPDHLIFQHLINKEKSDPYWDNDLMFTSDRFTRLSKDIIRRLGINLRRDKDEKIDIKKLITEMTQKNPPIRELFKKFFKEDEIQRLLNRKETNPFSDWIKENPHMSSEFNIALVEAVKFVLKSAHGAHDEDLVNYKA